MAQVIIVGLDLSLRASGIARICIQPPPTTSPKVDVTTETVISSGKKSDTAQMRSRRRRALRNAICSKAKDADLVVIEAPAFGVQGVAGVWDRACLWGAVVDAVDYLKIPYVTVPPAKVKQFAAGKGNADKAAVAAGMTRLWADHVSPGDDNQFDALALATLGAVRFAGRQIPITVLERHREVVAGITWPDEVKRGNRLNRST